MSATQVQSKKKQIMVIGVLGLATDGKGRFLLTQRNQPEDPEVHLSWQIPGGGMEFGESPEQTLSREMQEELGVSVRILYPFPMVKTSTFVLKDKNLHVTLIAYLVSLDGQIPKLEDPETKDFQWIDANDVAKLKTLPATDEFVFEAVEILKKILM